MRRLLALLVAVAGCTAGGGSTTPPDAAATDAAPAADAAALDATAAVSCAVFGAPGECVATADCAAIGDHSSYAGYCPGPADIQCCIQTPDVADNPPTPDGYRLMRQSEVTADMTAWAIEILHDPVTYPMFSTTTRTFGAQLVLARVEWHPPDFNNGAVHRGVTLYVPL